MNRHPFVELSREYELWVATVRPNPDRVSEIDRVARRLTRYDAMIQMGRVLAATRIPLVVQATIGERECGFDFTKNWGQGDPLTRPSTHVPKGRPPLGPPPNDHFPVSWEYAAIDAFTVCDQLNVLSVPAWSLSYACWKWEGYNGFGYRAHGRRSPYVVGGTNLQQPGKYVADGEFDAAHMDTQLGALPVALRMIELVPGLAFGAAIAAAAEPLALPPVAPLPASLGGSLTGTKWIQASLNVVQNINPPLKVDGSFGKKTRDAVRVYQAKHGLPANGLVDDVLCNALDIDLAAMRPTT